MISKINTQTLSKNENKHKLYLKVLSSTTDYYVCMYVYGNFSADFL